MATKESIVDYVMNNPQNTNSAVLSNMLNNCGGGLPDASFLENGTSLVAVDGEWELLKGYAYVKTEQLSFEWDGDITGKEEHPDAPHLYKIADDIPDAIKSNPYLMSGFILETRDEKGEVHSRDVITREWIEDNRNFCYSNYTIRKPDTWTDLIIIVPEDCEIDDEYSVYTIYKGIYFYSKTMSQWEGDRFFVSLFEGSVSSDLVFDDGFYKRPLIVNAEKPSDYSNIDFDISYNEVLDVIQNGRAVHIHFKVQNQGTTKTEIYTLASISTYMGNEPELIFKSGFSMTSQASFDYISWNRNGGYANNILSDTLNIALNINHTSKTVTAANTNSTPRFIYEHAMGPTVKIIVNTRDEESGYMWFYLADMLSDNSIVVYDKVVVNGKLEYKVKAIGTWDYNPASEGTWEYVE